MDPKREEYDVRLHCKITGATVKIEGIKAYSQTDAESRACSLMRESNYIEVDFSSLSSERI